jgi:hypothetical protein
MSNNATAIAVRRSVMKKFEVDIVPKAYSPINSIPTSRRNL